ncbi:dynein heavy chain, cytoplasmic-like isoform X2 [Prorops nasuta]|uniref:dynein heavy chain, cytoplasmic-like isoform X2 n=1 Tax=Prorops nasuta TaxID=863751 RepID=UPI0034CD8246
MGDSLVGFGEPPSELQNVAIVETVEYSQFANYLRKVVAILLPGEDTVPSDFNLALEDEKNQESIREFLSDSQISTLYIQRSSAKGDDSGETDKENNNFVYYISNEIHFTNPKMSFLVLTKSGTVVEADKSIHSQLRLVTFAGRSPYETLRAISNAMVLYFNSYVKATGRADEDGNKMAPLAEKAIAELEMGLLHLQQNTNIPEISLPVHLFVAQIIKQCSEENRKPKVADFGGKVEDSTFLNQLQNGVNKWIREIQKVTKLNWDLESGTALQEISFWLNLKRALYHIQEKRNSIEITLTLDILKHGKRFHATVSFDTDTGLKEALATVNDYLPLMEDFPINGLQSATDFERISASIKPIFTHLRKIRISKYPIQRVLRLIEAISRDLGQQLLKVLGSRRLMHIPFDDFEKVMSQCFDVFTTWDNEYDNFTGLLRDIVRKKWDEHVKMVREVFLAHKKLQTRMGHMRHFRRQHELLSTAIVRVLRPTIRQNSNSSKNANNNNIKVEFALHAANADVISEVNLAYENVTELDCLDITKKGLDSWDAAVNRYQERIERVENRITTHLRDRLGTAKNANEKFRIFSHFNALLSVRPYIRGGIREYQTQLIQRVKEDIEALHEKFKAQYAGSKCCKMSLVRGLPPVTGPIIWAKQIDYQLTMSLKRVEDVLGKGWEDHIEGRKVKADGDSFRMKLSTQEIFDDWARKVQQQNLVVAGCIFTIESVRSRTDGGGSVLKLKVNFLPEIITLSKEVRNLRNLGFRVPQAIVNKAHQVNYVYPFAISLIESIRTYERTLEKIKDKASITPLVAGMRKDVLTLISEGFDLFWESFKLDQYVQQFSDTVVSFQEKVEDLLVVEEQLVVDVRSLETCPYSANTFANILKKIQKSVDELASKNYSNLHIWVARLDEEVDKILAARLEAGIKAWENVLTGQNKVIDFSIDTDAINHHSERKSGGYPKIQNQIQEMRITNQKIYLHPSIEDTRFQIMEQLFAWQAIVTSQVRLQSTRYQVRLDKQESGTYRNLLTKLPGGKQSLEAAYEAVESKIKDIADYVDEWLHYQALLDLQPDNNLYRKLGKDINLWMSCLNNIKNSKHTFDTFSTKRQFGPVIINLAKLQSNEISTFTDQLLKYRNFLQQESNKNAIGSNNVRFITYINLLKKNMRAWEEQMDIYNKGHKFLECNKFPFPPSWVDLDNIEGEWVLINEIVERKDREIRMQVASVQNKIIETRTT